MQAMHIEHAEGEVTHQVLRENLQRDLETFFEDHRADLKEQHVEYDTWGVYGKPEVWPYSWISPQSYFGYPSAEEIVQPTLKPQSSIEYCEQLVWPAHPTETLNYPWEDDFVNVASTKAAAIDAHETDVVSSTSKTTLIEISPVPSPRQLLNPRDSPTRDADLEVQFPIEDTFNTTSNQGITVAGRDEAAFSQTNAVNMDPLPKEGYTSITSTAEEPNAISDTPYPTENMPDPVPAVHMKADNSVEDGSGHSDAVPVAGGSNSVNNPPPQNDGPPTGMYAGSWHHAIWRGMRDLGAQDQSTFYKIQTIYQAAYPYYKESRTIKTAQNSMRPSLSDPTGTMYFQHGTRGMWGLRPVPLSRSVATKICVEKKKKNAKK